jgi:hypothetical protein
MSASRFKQGEAEKLGNEVMERVGYFPDRLKK